MRIWKMIAAIILVVAVAVMMMESIYPLAGKIIGVEYDNDLVIIEDCFGSVWVYKGIDDETICGEPIAMLMWNRFTPYSDLDDVILKIN